MLTVFQYMYIYSLQYKIHYDYLRNTIVQNIVHPMERWIKHDLTLFHFNNSLFFTHSAKIAAL